VLSTLVADFRIIFERDPAARNWLEVSTLVCKRSYTGWLTSFSFGIPFIPLNFLLCSILTGIEIHPAQWARFLLTTGWGRNW